MPPEPKRNILTHDKVPAVWAVVQKARANGQIQSDADERRMLVESMVKGRDRDVAAHNMKVLQAATDFRRLYKTTAPGETMEQKWLSFVKDGGFDQESFNKYLDQRRFEIANPVVPDWGFEGRPEERHAEAVEMGVPKGSLGRHAVALAGGASDALLSLPGVERGLRAAGAGNVIDTGRALVGRSIEEEGTSGSIANVVGGAIPVVASGTALGAGLAARGVGPIANSILTGGALGGAFTPGDFGTRVAGSVAGGAMLGGAAYLNRFAAPLIRGVENSILGSGVEPHAARVIASKLAPAIARTSFDAAAFTGLGVIEHEIHQAIGGRMGEPDPALYQQFLANLAVVGTAHAMAYKLPSEAARTAEAKRAEAMVDFIDAQRGPIGKEKAAFLLRHFNSAAAVRTAYVAALRKAGLTAPEVAAMIRGGSPKLIELVAPERARELFVPDLRSVQESVPTGEPQATHRPKTEIIASKIEKTGKSQQYAEKRLHKERVKEGHAEVDRRLAQRKFEEEMLRADEVEHGRTVGELRAEGRNAEIPENVAEFAPIVPGNPTRAERMDATFKNKVRGVQKQLEGAERVAAKALERHEATVERYGPDSPQARGSQRTMVAAQNKVAQIRNAAQDVVAQAEDVRIEVDRTRHGLTRRDLIELGREAEIPPNFPDSIRVIEGNPAKAAEIRAKARAKMESEHQRSNRLGEAARERQVRQESAIDVLRDRQIQLAIEYDQALLDASTGILPKNSRGERLLSILTAPDAAALMARLRETSSSPSPFQELAPLDVATPEGFKQLKAAVDSIPLTEPAAVRARLAMEADPNTVVKRPSMSSAGRQIAVTMPKVFGPEYGRLLAAHMAYSDAKTGQMLDLTKRKVRRTWLKFVRYQETLPEEMRAEALERFVRAMHGADTAQHPIEIETVHVMQRLLGRHATQLRELGFPVRENYGFAHVYETIRAAEASDAAISATAKMLAETIGSKPAGTFQGSRFLMERRSTRQDFLRDFPKVMDLYLDSVIPKIQWQSAHNFVENTLVPEVRRRAELEIKNASEAGGASWKTEDVARIRQRAEKAIEFARKHVAAGAGNKPRDKVIEGIDGALTDYAEKIKVKLPNEHPVRSLINGKVAANFLGAFALNAGAVVRNTLQSALTVAEIGPQWTALGLLKLFPKRVMRGGDTTAELRQTADYPRLMGRGLLRLFGRELHPLVARSGIVGAGRISEINDIFVRSSGGAIKKHTVGVLRGLASLFHGAEILLRGSAYLGGYYKAKSQGAGEMQAREFGHRIASKTQFDYAHGFGGLIYSQPTAHLGLQFVRFPWYYADYLYQTGRRAVAGDPRTIMPHEQPFASLVRLAVAWYALDAAMDEINLSFDDGIMFGGLGEMVKQPVTAGTEGVTRSLYTATGRPGAEGALTARRALRNANMEAFSTSPGEAFLRSFGSDVGAAGNLWKWAFGSPSEQADMDRTFLRSVLPLFPGVAADRFMRYQKEAREHVVRDRFTGEPRFPISDVDATARLLGVQTGDVIDNYNAIRDQKLLDEYAKTKNRQLLQHVRDIYREARAANDPDAGPKAWGEYLAGMRSMYEFMGVSMNIEEDELIGRFRRSVVDDVVEGENTTAAQRLIDRSRILRQLDRQGR